MKTIVPEVVVAVIGGSAIIGSGFPGALEGVEVIEEDIVYETPFGPSAPFTRASLEGKEFLYVPFHGITDEIRNTEPDSAGERLFYVLMKAGVRKIIGCALCGSTNRLLDPADVVIPDGFVDYTTKRAQSLTRSLRRKGVDVESTMYRLHRPFCPTLSGLLVEGSREAGFPRVFSRGTVGVAEGPRLESPSEIRKRYADEGLDVVTMNLVPEVFFAREIGACYAALELVSNYGEGLVSTEWSGHGAFSEFQERWSRPAAEAILHALREMDVDDESCSCPMYRWRTIIE
ncbi:MAG: MTAP family purine nucleoside phosphorylase [Candidatus Bathyarchaeota archaeon]|nr:MAG: MTAP family purine nucleoside phosphorylase [Candidatus Bathyarchaeota archaeon]